MEHTVFERKGVRVVIPTPHSYKDVATLIKSDNFRYRGETLPIYKIFLQTLVMGGGKNASFLVQSFSIPEGLALLFRKIQTEESICPLWTSIAKYN